MSQALIHTEDSYMLAITGLTQVQIIDRLKEDGYKMGRTSLQNLLSGLVEKSCGFTLNSELAPAEVDLAKAADTVLNVKRKVLIIDDTTEGIETYKEPRSLTRNQREGRYGGSITGCRDIATLVHWRTKTEGNDLKTHSRWMRRNGVTSKPRNLSEGRGRRQPKNFYISKARRAAFDEASV